MGGPAPKKPETAAAAPVALAEKVFMVDDFESGSLKSPRDWWTFDIKKAEIADNKALTGGETLNVGKYSLLLSGPAKNWYAGGCGIYIAKENQDLSKYSTFSVDVFGRGPGSGTVKVELYDDDNGNWQIEQDPAKAYAPIYDDKWVYEIKVDWDGWKRVSVPIADFVDDNPGVGDDVWNPQQTNGSGGLLQVQFVCLASTDKGEVNVNLDNVMLTAGEK
ncbi:MAG TPA: carbohydrate binding domain-containing protein [Candidatus Sulfotelmatobacter sp.]|nr:carbohydrate binding domain-containing protein [Candidatus Sulfotelmatobacter sp.]